MELNELATGDMGKPWETQGSQDCGFAASLFMFEAVTREFCKVLIGDAKACWTRGCCSILVFLTSTLSFSDRGWNSRYRKWGLGLTRNCKIVILIGVALSLFCSGEILEDVECYGLSFCSGELFPWFCQNVGFDPGLAVVFPTTIFSSHHTHTCHVHRHLRCPARLPGALSSLYDSLLSRSLSSSIVPRASRHKTIWFLANGIRMESERHPFFSLEQKWYNSYNS